MVQITLGARSTLSKRAVSDFEKGRRLLSPRNLVAVLYAFEGGASACRVRDEGSVDRFRRVSGCCIVPRSIALIFVTPLLLAALLVRCKDFYLF